MAHRPERGIAGRQAAIEGNANEHIVVALLMKKYGNATLVDLKLSSFDVVLVRKVGNQEDFIRI